MTIVWFQGPLDWKLMDQILAPSRSVGVRSFSSVTYQSENWRQNFLLSGQLQGRIVIGLANNRADANPEDQMGPPNVLSLVGPKNQCQPTDIKMVLHMFL